MYAVIDVLGKQYKAQIGRELVVDFCQKDVGKDLEFPVLLLSDDDGKCRVGSPYVDGAKVRAKVGDSFRDKKVLIFKYKRRKGYRKTRGHRQSYTRMMITGIDG